MAESPTKSDRTSEIFSPRRWLTIDYSPHPEERSFLERAQTRSESEVEATVAVPSDRESERIFGVRLARHRMQAVWLEVMNGGQNRSGSTASNSIPTTTPRWRPRNLRAFAMGTRLLAFGVLGWLFLPLLRWFRLSSSLLAPRTDA